MTRMTKGNDFKQNNLPFLKFVLTPKWMVIFLSLVFVVFLPMGIGFYVNNAQLKESSFDYTNCIDATSTDFIQAPGQESVTWRFDPKKLLCTIRFSIASDLSASVLLYIRLTQFYQNHRLYVTSLDTKQLKGDIIENAADLAHGTSDLNCAWLQYANCTTASKYYWTSGNGLSYSQNNPDCLPSPLNRSLVIQNAKVNAQYYPCGLVANSMFSDEISDLKCIGDCKLNVYTFSDRNIAWKQDASLYNMTGWAFDDSLKASIPTMLIPPPQWRKAWPAKWGNGYNATNLPDLKQWERFQVWMRKAGLPTFRKLWGRNDSVTLPRGQWEMNISYTFDVKRFNGTKSIVFSQVGVLGIQDAFVPIGFLTIACIAGCMAIFIYFAQFRKLGDHQWLSWNKEKSE